MDRQTRFLFTLLLMLYAAAPAYATPEYAEKTRQGCIACHSSEEGGELNDSGLAFLFSGYVWPPPADGKAMLNLGGAARAFTGFLHIVASVMWFGTIIYVHVILKPAYASKGLPKDEVRLGVASMAVLGVTGLLLMLSRINDFSVLAETRWGGLLSVKIVLYLLLVASAVFVVLYIGPRLQQKKEPKASQDSVFNAAALAVCDGKEGRPVYIAYKGKVYDVSGLGKWKSGVHFRHPCGEDLTEMLPKAPHGEEKLEKIRVAGTFNASLQPDKTPTQKLFYCMAYTNLAAVFVVLAVIAIWRWGM